MLNESVNEWFRSQLGLITAQQALGSGMSRSAIDRRVRSGEWERVHPSVFRLQAMPTSWHQACLAAVIWLGRGGSAALSHLSALRLWGLDDGMERDQTIEVSVAHAIQSRDRRIRIHRVRHLDRADLTIRAGIPVTSAGRTLLDTGDRVGQGRLERCVEEAIKLRVASHDDLGRVVERLGRSGQRGTLALRTVLEARAPGGPGAADGRLEQAAWALIRSSGLPLPVRQHVVVVQGVDWTVDFFWPRAHVGLETDGYSSHAGRAAFRQDRRKLRALATAGCRILPATWWDVTSASEALVSDLSAALRLSR